MTVRTDIGVGGATPRRGVRPEGWGVWALAAVLAAVVGAAAAVPKAALALVALALLGAIAAWAMRRPINAFLAALLFYPFYPLLRGVAQVKGVPLPFAVLGMWPELVLSAMVVGECVRSCRPGAPRLRVSWADLPVLVLVAGALYGIVLSVSQRMLSATVYGLHYSLTALLFYFAALWSRPTERDLRRVLAVFAGTFVALSLPSFFDYVFRTSLIVEVSTQLRPMITGPWEPNQFWRTYPRMQSLLLDENLWGTVCALAAFLAMSSMVTPVAKRPAADGALSPRSTLASRVRAWFPTLLRFNVLLFGLAVLGLMLSMSRGAIACFALGMLAFPLLQGRARGRTALLYAALGVAGLVAYHYLSQQPQFAVALVRLASLGDTQSRVAYDRVDMWKAAWDSFQQFPSGTGLGTGGHAAAFHGGGAVVTDGMYFKILAEQGVVGAVVWAVGLLGVLWTNVTLLQRLSGVERVMGLTASVYLIGVLAQNVGSNTMDFYYTPVFLWASFGFVAARHRQAAPGGGKSPPESAPEGALALPPLREGA